MKLIPKLVRFKQCKVIIHFVYRCTGGKNSGQKEIFRVCCILPTNQSCFSAKPQKLLAPWGGGGGGVALHTFLAYSIIILHISCFSISRPPPQIFLLNLRLKLIGIAHLCYNLPKRGAAARSLYPILYVFEFVYFELELTISRKINE